MGLNRNLGNIPQVITELNGNIGIGTTSPANKLTVIGNIYAGGGFIGYRADGGVGLEVNGGDLGSGSYIAKFNDFSNNTKVVITGNGNVGIGTSSIGYKCQIENNGADVFLTKNTSSTSFNRSFFYNNNNTGIQIASFGTAYPFGTEFGVGQGGATLLSNTNSAFALGTNTNTPLYLGTNGTTRINVTSGGNVLLSSGSDNGYRLQVNGSITATSLALAGNYNADVTTNSGWTSYQTIISPGTLLPGVTYMISIRWNFSAGSNQPYYCYCSFLWVGVPTNGAGGTDNEFTPACSTHTGGGGNISFRSIAALASTSGVQARLNGFATFGGVMAVKAIRLE